MALEKFRAPALPNPTDDIPRPTQEYLRQMIRALGLYFNKLDSLTPNQADSYRADTFLGGTVTLLNATTAEKGALTATEGMLVFDTDLDKLCIYTSGGWQTVTST